MQRKRMIFRILLLIALVTVFVAVFCMSASAMQIFIQIDYSGLNLEGAGVKTCEVEPTDRVEDFHAKILDLTGLTRDEYHITFRSTVLSDDSNTLQDYSVTKDSTITIEAHSFDNCLDAYCNTPGCNFERSTPAHVYTDEIDVICDAPGCYYARQIIFLQFVEIVDLKFQQVGETFSIEYSETLTTDDIRLLIEDKTGDADSKYLYYLLPNESSPDDEFNKDLFIDEGATMQDSGIEAYRAIALLLHNEHIFFNCQCMICDFVRPHAFSDCTDHFCNNDDCLYLRTDAQPSHAYTDCLDADCNNADCPYVREPYTEHSFSDCTDATCNNDDGGCPFTRVANEAHSYTDCTDAECNTEGCGFIRTPSASHAYTDCLDESCDNENCPYTREPSVAHAFDGCTDAKCNNEGCGFTREANSAHIYTDCTDTDCNTPDCNITREANPAHIFDGCLDGECNSVDCPYTREPKAHEGGTPTCVRASVCVNCGNEYGEVLPHSPNNDEWVTTDAHHYHRCAYWSEISSCKEKYDYAEHSYGEWTVTKEADVLITGMQERVCACGHIDYEEIPAKPMFDKPIGTTEWIALGVAVALVLIVGAVCWYIKKP